MEDNLSNLLSKNSRKLAQKQFDSDDLELPVRREMERSSRLFLELVNVILFREESMSSQQEVY